MHRNMMRNPEKWIGRTAPNNLEWDHFWRVIDKCDDCQRFAKTDDLHPLLSRESEADQALMNALGVEDPMTYCPECLAALEAEADQIDSGWRERHGYA